MRRYIEKFRSQLTGSSRLIAGVLCSVLLLGMLVGVTGTHGLVTITDQGGSSYTMLTANDKPYQLMHKMAAMVGVNDKLVYTTRNERANLLIQRAFPAFVRADGEVHSAEFVDGTVSDLLSRCDIQLEGEDFVEPALNTPLQRDMEVAVRRVTYQEEKKREQVSDSLVSDYQARVLAENPASQFRKSNGGVYDVVYRHKLIDGVVEQSFIASLAPIITPRPAGSTSFTPGIPCSTIQGFDGVQLGENGLPTNYRRVMRGAVCTAYSASRGRGASGLGLYCGTVAVNPRVIPYGTRLYITASDNSFVYGYAIATDTGGAMMDGRVDIDLFFGTNGEAMRFGKRALDVYIL